MKKVISLSVDPMVYEEFSEMCNKKGWIISKQVENYMRNLLSNKQ